MRADNIESDHCVGSEFYDSQIECKFTDPGPEERLIKAQSSFHHAAFQRFGKRLSQLTRESLELIAELSPPITFSEREAKNVIDLLYKLNAETLSSINLKSLLLERGEPAEDLGSLKKLNRLLQIELRDEPISPVLAPLFALNDLRVAYFTCNRQ